MQGPTGIEVSVFVYCTLRITALEFNDDEDVVKTDYQDELEEEEENEHITDLLDSMRKSFIKPLHVLQELSGFPNLLPLYTIFFSLAVSSASAERALSKLKIVKNRLRSSLCDDMLSSLMLIASEKDLMHAIRNEDIISRIANATPSLKAHLMFS